MKLEIANHELEAFAYSVAHDLRAPLRSIQGMAGALREDCGPQLDATALDYMDRMREASQRMDALIRDMLAYTQITRMEAELGPVDLRGTLEEAKDSLAADLNQSRAQIDFEGHFPSVLANRTLLMQALVNLFSNAIKFVGPGVQPAIKVFVRNKGQKIRLYVQDNGIGIAPEFKEKIFKMFERLHPSSAYPGTGIGLAIVEKAVQRMNGLVGFESTPGQGSCFWLELPEA